MFEYKILRADGFVSVEELNGLGNQFWELVSVLPDDEGCDYIFKRARSSSAIIDFVNNNNNINKVNAPTANQILEIVRNSNEV